VSTSTNADFRAVQNAPMLSRLLRLVLAIALLAVLVAPAAFAAMGLDPAEEMLVVKSERRLYLLRGGAPFKSYRIALGLDPVGHKEREGDFRTPEGRYRLDGRNPSSDYYLSLHVSYPNANDLKHARSRHWQPGGSIMIHGMPNIPKHPLDYYRRADWTNGCIALSNDDMLEVWLLSRPDMPIEIRP
jgi:murein L,D-transpeptidase YafK